MSLVHRVYFCFFLLGLVSACVALSGIMFSNLPGAFVFLFGFVAVALLTISLGELRHPVKAPYRPPAQ